MAYYLLRVEEPGVNSYAAAARAKHMIEAASIDHAKQDADEIVQRHYPKGDKATLQLFDERGLVATRVGTGQWNA